MKLANKVSKLKTRILNLSSQIKAIQDECPHPPTAVRYCYGANTGNYDPSSDCYWIDFFCSECLNKWTAFSDTDYEGYHRDLKGSVEVENKKDLVV